MAKAIYKVSFQYSPDIFFDGIFVAEMADAEAIPNRLVYSPCLGAPYYRPSVRLESSNITCITDDPELIEKFEQLGMETGWNPLKS